MSGYLLKFKQTYSVKIGGRRYPVVKIGNQLWMAENLDYAWSGLPIGNMYMSTSDSQACYYDNDELTNGWNGRKCGLLYNWAAVNYLEQNKNVLLPNGWRVASASDYDNLFLNPISQLKSENKDWFSNGGTNETGFSALPSGRWNGSAAPYFRFLGTDNYLFTSSSTSSTLAPIYWVDFANDSLGHDNYYPKDATGSIRLVKSLT